MIIQCDKCQTKFRLDDSKVKGAGVKVRCTKCQSVFIVTPPIEDVAAEEAIAQPSADRKEAAERPREKTIGKENLSFEFSESLKEPSPEKEMEKEEEGGTGAPSVGAGADTEGPGLDFSFKGFGADEESGKGADEAPQERVSEVPERAERTLGGFDLGLAAGGAEKEGAVVKEEPSIGTGGYAVEATEAREERKVEPAMEAPEERGSAEPPSVAGYDVAGGGPAEPSFNEEISSGDFSEALKESVEKGGEMPPHTEEVYYDEEAAPSARGKAWVVLAVAVLVVIIGLGVLYFRGAGRMAGGLISRDGATAAKKTVDIEGIKGYFVENKNAGRVFVIEARIRNLSDAAQEIKSIKGVLYNARGAKLTERSAAPGRVVSADDLKALPKDELLKQFKDPSGGSIPPKGTIPVMVLFTEVPAELSEYGVDIVR